MTLSARLQLSNLGRSPVTTDLHASLMTLRNWNAREAPTLERNALWQTRKTRAWRKNKCEKCATSHNSLACIDKLTRKIHLTWRYSTFRVEIPTVESTPYVVKLKINCRREKKINGCSSSLLASAFTCEWVNVKWGRSNYIQCLIHKLSSDI